MLRFYFEVARTAFRRQVVYRWANLAGLLTNIFFGIIFSYLIIALYYARPVVTGYNVADALRYTWLEQSMIMVIMPFSWYDLMLTIRSGEIVTDLSKPCDFSLYWFSREVGRSCYYIIFRGIPTYIAGALLFRLGIPGNGWSWLAMLLAFPLGIVLGIAYRYLYNIMAFWIIEARGVALLAATVAFFFTGSLIPLPFFPAWLRVIADWSPFSDLMNVPTEVMLGKVSGSMLFLVLGRQLCWCLLLVLAVRWLTDRATRRVVVQGG